MMQNELYQYVLSANVRRHNLFLAPSWKQWKDKERFDRAIDEFWRYGVIPDAKDMLLLPSAPLTLAEIQDFNARLCHVGPASLPQIQEAFTVLHRYSARSQCNGKLHAAWRVACLRHWMTDGYERNQFEYHILKQCLPDT